jgi:predicted kinase
MTKKASLIVIGGFAGAGKTTVATRLSGEHNLPILSSDVINDALRPALGKGFHEVSPVAYEVMWHLARQQLATGVTTIIDTHMATRKVWDSLDALKREMPDIVVLPIILQATLETHRRRIEERGRTDKEHLNLGGSKLADVLFKYEYIERLNRFDLVRIDANGRLDDVYESVATLVKEQLGLK